MKKTVVFVIALAALVSAAFVGCKKTGGTDNSLADLKARGEFVLGLDDSFPPMGFRDENNEIVGFDIDLAKEVANRLGVKFRAQPINWDAKEQELSTGNIDCIWNGLTITEERKAMLSFSKPYLANEQIVVIRKNSGMIPGIRPGKPTADYIQKIISRITLLGALLISVVALFPILMTQFTQLIGKPMTLSLGGTSLIIVVGVALETVKSLESQMMMRHYKGFLD